VDLLGGAEKNREKPQKNLPLGQDLNPGPVKYEAGVITIRLILSIKNNRPRCTENTNCTFSVPTFDRNYMEVIKMRRI
jgi:hypothetical protein